MLPSQKIIDALNEQVGMEMSASIKYDAIAAHFAQRDRRQQMLDPRGVEIAAPGRRSVPPQRHPVDRQRRIRAAQAERLEQCPRPLPGPI